MKKIIIIILLIATAFFSCKKKSLDTTPPVITLNGAATVYVDKGNPYTDEGATATDDIDGDITDKIIVNNPVDVNTVNVYYVTYNVSDKAGNQATEVRRKVDVKIF